MSIVLFILGEQPPSLIGGYDDFVLAANEFLGYGDDSTLWTTQQVAELDRRVQDAYRYCLHPSTIPGERIPHVWSFLEQETTLTTVAGDYDYTLPAAFGSMSGDITFAAGTGYGPIKQSSPQAIRTERQFSNRTGVPEHYAVRWVAQTSGLNQRQELLLYPTPDGAYVLTYCYVLQAPRLSKANPYPLGGPRMSQLMIEATKAVAEAAKNGAPGPQWGVFVGRMNDAIQMDKGTNFSPTVGFLRGADHRTVRGHLIGTVSYYFGPNAAGVYTLES